MEIVKHKIKKEYMDLILKGEKQWEIRKFDNDKHVFNHKEIDGIISLELEVIETGEKYIFNAIVFTSYFLDFLDINLFFPHLDSVSEIKAKLKECGIGNNTKQVYFKLEI